jgi:N-acetylneuraminic acid mutarotase
MRVKFILILILLLLVLFSVISSQSNTVVAWQSYEGAPIAIYAGGFVSCDDALYSIGGSSSGRFQRNNYQYDPATNKWTKKASMKSDHKNAAYVSVNGKIHVIAGDPFSDVHEVYDPIKDEWSFLAPIPTKIQHVMGVTVNNKIYVMGGLENWSYISNKNQVYDIKTDSWVEMAPMPIGKHGYSSIVYDDKIYVFGSLAFDTTGKEGVYGSNSSIEVYDTKTDTWENIGNMPTLLYLGAIVVYGDEVIIIGGFRDKDEPEARVDIFSLETHTWREGLPIPKPFVGMGAVEYNNQLYVSGGADSLNNWLTNEKLFQIPIKELLENID